MRRFRHALLIGIVILASNCQPLRTPVESAHTVDGSDHAALVQAAEHFLRVFDNMEWEAFQTTWSTSPTVFFPFRDTPERVEGPAVAARFRAFFDEVRSTRPGPPYLRLHPQEFRAEVMGSTGFVTFMLGRAPGNVSRRTLLFVRESGQWKLAHMHASNVEAARP